MRKTPPSNNGRSIKHLIRSYPEMIRKDSLIEKWPRKCGIKLRRINKIRSGLMSSSKSWKIITNSDISSPKVISSAVVSHNKAIKSHSNSSNSRYKSNLNLNTTSTAKAAIKMRSQTIQLTFKSTRKDRAPNKEKTISKTTNHFPEC